MMTPDRPKFIAFLTSPAASQDAQNASKNSVFFGFATALFVVFARPWDFGLVWVPIFLGLAFAISIFVAVPVWFARMTSAWLNWHRPAIARLLTSSIDLIGVAAYVVFTYFGLRALWFWTN
ncbi:MAG: hypothetical protein ACK5QD_00300 [Brevundimonas sp.]|uniref:hypothetical protein n=1 Tax=Brevundimonas sp. TaxID=1871086 RepID=UPI0039193F36